LNFDITAVDTVYVTRCPEGILQKTFSFPVALVVFKWK